MRSSKWFHKLGPSCTFALTIAIFGGLWAFADCKLQLEDANKKAFEMAQPLPPVVAIIHSDSAINAHGAFHLISEDSAPARVDEPL